MLMTGEELRLASAAITALRDALAAPAKPCNHDLFKTGDSDAPEQVKDRNGEVVLAMCRKCGKAEAELPTQGAEE